MSTSHNSNLPATMTPSSTPTNKGHDRSSLRHEDSTDWVVVKGGVDTDKEDFEMIDSTEAHCWCGGADPDICRQKGHRWPLTHVDQEELLPKEHNQSSRHLHEEKDKDQSGSSNSDGDLSTCETYTCDPGVCDTRPKKNPRIDIPSASHNTTSGPFSTLAVLTDLLDPTRDDDEDLYSAYKK